MGTLLSKINYLKETKELIRQAIISKGTSVNLSVPFRLYADLIKSIGSAEIISESIINKVNIDYTDTLESKLFYLKETKELIRQALLFKGVSVDQSIPFRQYSNLIETIELDKEPTPDPEPPINTVYGIEIDESNPDPHLKRVGNLELHKTLPVQSLYRGCIAKGGMVNYYLDPTDWSKKADGTPSKLDGTDGTVRVHTPKFYGRYREITNQPGHKVIEICLTKPVSDEFPDVPWEEIPEMLIDAYGCTLDRRDPSNIKTACVVNSTPEFRGGNNNPAFDNDVEITKRDLEKPVGNISLAEMRGYAKNAGSELLCYEFYKWVFVWNYVIEYANLNSQDTFNSELTTEGYHQGGLGAGVTTWDKTKWMTYNNEAAVTPCGYCNSIGNGTGIKAMNLPSQGITFQVPRWRGFDVVFGDVWLILEGALLYDRCLYSTSNPLYYGDTIDNKTNLNSDILLPAGKVYSSFTKIIRNELIPSSTGGSYSTYFCDYFAIKDRRPTFPYNLVKVGGGARYGTMCGLFCIDIHDEITLAESKMRYITLNRVVSV